MKKIFLTISLLGALTNSFANTSQADWIVEASTLTISGQAAEDLYESLDAFKMVNPLSTKYDVTFSKKNSFASCSLRLLRTDLPDGDSAWEVESAECKIKAPQGTTINQ